MEVDVFYIIDDLLIGIFDLNGFIMGDDVVLSLVNLCIGIFRILLVVGSGLMVDVLVRILIVNFWFGIFDL